MARTSMYYYQHSPSCLLCFRRTNEVKSFLSESYDLDDRRVNITLHHSCYQKKIGWFLAKALLSAFFFWAALILIELMFIEYPIDLTRPFQNLDKIPGWLNVINYFAVFIIGVSVYFKGYFGLRRFFNKHVLLNTIPID
jgi:hypothetical protein